ncbi:MAG: polysaccharide biosynthesis protein [Pyrinomonadaceae bacterium]|nr:polysaccharide biosynthesis protein [Pyrinomonadaceae bacterium]MCX7640278.1 polysaccharide biosynthesis protein [Pyrinomonadaceae bacterium]MDW8305274.1 nucleoside-diphosphate sugar epimerase/dehydratase [Acidobacteriota bacterium]
MQEKLSEKLWFLRRPLQVFADFFILCLSFFFSYLLRFDFSLPQYYLENALNQLPLVVLIQFLSLFLVGGYSILWRYISLDDVKIFLKAAAISSFVLVSLRLLLPSDFVRWQVPLSITLMHTVFAFSGLLALRLARRLFYEISEKKNFSRRRRVKAKPALLIGAGRIGSAIVKEISGRADAEISIKGFVDDDKRKVGALINGIKILGTTADLPRLVNELKIELVVITLDEAQGKQIRDILEVCRQIPVKTQIVPSLNEIVGGRVSINRIRDVQIEDLLGREPINLDLQNLHEFLSKKIVLVTGAGGSIGSELVRQIARFSPSLILLVERAEGALFQIERSLKNDFPELRYEPLVADVADRSRMYDIFSRFNPQVIFHAAAHKHVPLMEKNVVEAIKNNVFATVLLAELAGRTDAETFVLISTDKAVNPVSVMGASKRLAEIAVQSFHERYKTRFISVRFGNVLGSNGSVVPIFLEQILRGGPVTVTDPNMKRYFMTISEAVQLVLQAGSIGKGGEIFILDMGKPVRILDLAEDMIRLSGLRPYEDIEIVFTGRRPGEKLFEELEVLGENMVKTGHPKIFIGKINKYPSSEVKKMLESLQVAVSEGDERKIRLLINDFLPEANVEVCEEAAEVS